MPTRVCLAFLCVLAATALQADPPTVGADAPNFKAKGKLINPPEFARELKDCKGDVILIYEWHIRDGTAEGLAHIQTKWAKYAGKGLHVFAIHRLDFEKWPQVEPYCRDKKYTFCVPMGGFYDESNDFFGYKDGKNFRAGVVGVDGKVAWYGKDDGWKTALDAELAKLVYPNLGKHEVHEDAKSAAEELGKREFGKALTEAEKLLAGEVNPEARPDLELIVERAKGIANARQERITAWTDEKRYDLVMKTHELMKAEFRLHQLGEDAEEAIKALKKDKVIKKELKSFEYLDALIEKESTGGWREYANALHAFAKAQSQFKAAEVAEAMAKSLEFEMEE
ncbi:MAG: hypothetical protein K8I27_10370 [Planctomycetes bacterium]|nr:hypothetical protein [Planctomycetota bacterium]